MMSEAQAEWIEESRRLTLTVLANLASLAARSGSYRLGSMVRDLAEQAHMWAESVPGALVERDGADLDADVLAEAATYAGRCAAGLRRRMEVGRHSLSFETGRIAVSCAADLDEHVGWADRIVRSLEKNGCGAATREFRVLLPSRSEFVGEERLQALACTASTGHRQRDEEDDEVSDVPRGDGVVRDSGCRGTDGRRPGGG